MPQGMTNSRGTPKRVGEREGRGAGRPEPCPTHPEAPVRALPPPALLLAWPRPCFLTGTELGWHGCFREAAARATLPNSPHSSLENGPHHMGAMTFLTVHPLPGPTANSLMPPTPAWAHTPISVNSCSTESPSRYPPQSPRSCPWLGGSLEQRQEPCP